MGLHRAAFGLLLLLVGCDSHIITESAQPDAIEAARTWYEAAIVQADSASTAKSGSFDTSPLVKRFAPDWSKVVVLKGKSGGSVVTTVLGKDAGVSFDPTVFVLRVIVQEVNNSGEVESATLVEFISATSLESIVFPTTYSGGWMRISRSIGS